MAEHSHTHTHDGVTHTHEHSHDDEHHDHTRWNRLLFFNAYFESASFSSVCSGISRALAHKRHRPIERPSCWCGTGRNRPPDLDS
jgi:hypothetical protein